MTLQVKWLDRGREPQCPPDPDFPKGRVIDMSSGGAHCVIKLDAIGLYPTPRCGYLLVECDVCGQNALLTTAGRPDDPRIVVMGCMPSKQRH